MKIAMKKLMTLLAVAALPVLVHARTPDQISGLSCRGDAKGKYKIDFRFGFRTMSQNRDHRSFGTPEVPPIKLWTIGFVEGDFVCGVVQYPIKSRLHPGLRPDWYFVCQQYFKDNDDALSGYRFFFYPGIQGADKIVFYDSEGDKIPEASQNVECKTGPLD